MKLFVLLDIVSVLLLILSVIGGIALLVYGWVWPYPFKLILETESCLLLAVILRLAKQSYFDFIEEEWIKDTWRNLYDSD